MQKEIQLHDLRLSFIWVETTLDLLDDAVPTDAPLAFLGRRHSYAKHFDQILLSNASHEGLQVPWPRPSGDLFWTYYLKCKPGRVTGLRAWKALVPLRKVLPAEVKAQWLPGRLLLEAFFYPHGLALIVTAICQTHLTLNNTVDKAFEIRRTGRFQVKWQGRKTSEYLSLDRLADKGLTKLRKAATGKRVSSGGMSVTPVTVVTVVRGSGVDPAIATPNGREVHRALEAMATWRPTWHYNDLPKLAQACLKIRTAPPSHVLYGQRRGRVIWFPGLFTQQTKRLRSLSCYHRNLVFDLLQVESLSDLVLKTAEQIEEGQKISVTQSECTRRAAGILCRLYRGAFSTYRSWSSRTHIELNNLVEVLNKVRDLYNMDPL